MFRINIWNALVSEGWAHQEFSSLSAEHRETILRGLAERMTPPNIIFFPFYSLLSHGLDKLGPLGRYFGGDDIEY